MENKLKVLPVLFPTGIDSRKLDKNILKYIRGVFYNCGKPYNIYFTSKEELIEKDGKWSPLHQLSTKEGLKMFGGIKSKIVATTYKSLNLPLIPEQWIKDVYMPRNGVVGDVYIEMEEKVTNGSWTNYESEKTGELVPKLTQDNEVVIVSSE